MEAEDWWVCQILTEILMQAEVEPRLMGGPAEFHVLVLLTIMVLQEASIKVDKEED